MDGSRIHQILCFVVNGNDRTRPNTHEIDLFVRKIQFGKPSETGKRRMCLHAHKHPLAATQSGKASVNSVPDFRSLCRLRTKSRTKPGKTKGVSMSVLRSL